MKVAAVLILPALLFAVYCSCRKSKSTEGDSSDSLKIAISNFRTDSLGCHGLRSKNSIGFIYEEGLIKGKFKEELIGLIGKPNDSVSANGLLNLRYYFGRTCSGETPVDSVERCWSNFRVDIHSGKVSGIEFVCQ